MSAWKLVEAVAEEPSPDFPKLTDEPVARSSSSAPSHSSPSRRGGGSGGRGRGGRSEGSSRGGGRGRNGHSPHNHNPHSPSSPNSSSSPSRHPGPSRSKADRSYFSYLAVQQMDSIFNPDSLCMDTYVRTYMDEAGYVPISLLCGYQNVAQYQCTYNDILHKLKETVGKCKFIEMDEENETVRLKSGWDKFLMPNGYGGRGLPRYVKQPKPKISAPTTPTTATATTAAGEATTSNTTEGGIGTVTDDANAMNVQYAYWLSQMASFGGYYPTAAAYADPSMYYADPTAAAMAYGYMNSYAYPTYPTEAGVGEGTEILEEQGETSFEVVEGETDGNDLKEGENVVAESRVEEESK